MKAFKEAEKQGFNIELDVRITKDNKLIVVHDKIINKKNVEKINYKDLPKIKNQKIELLETILKYFQNKKTGVLIELKATLKSKILCKETEKLLYKYKGNFAIISFDPRLVKYFKNIVPTGMSFEKRYNKLVFNFSKASFIVLEKSLINKSKIKNIPIIVWTISSKKDFKITYLKATNIIFDKFNWNFRIK